MFNAQLDDLDLIRTEAELRAHYPAPTPLKVMAYVTPEAADFIAHCPFVCIASCSAERGADLSPRGDAPGFVSVLDEHTVALPDWPGNNRLDTLVNVVHNPAVGLLFFIPGLNETLRINGRAQISASPALLERFRQGEKVPRSVMLVHVEELFLHCSKAFSRSRLWDPDYRMDREQLPSLRGLTTGPVPLPTPPPLPAIKAPTSTAQSPRRRAGRGS